MSGGGQRQGWLQRRYNSVLSPHWIDCMERIEHRLSSFVLEVFLSETRYCRTVPYQGPSHYGTVAPIPPVDYFTSSTTTKLP